jgi:streptomycin 6-kinase
VTEFSTSSSLAHIAHEVAAHWGLVLGEPFPAHYSYVAPAGRHAVLKVQLGGDDESQQEAEALELWKGGGAVRLLRRDAEHRVLLLERAVPGNDISELSEEMATSVALKVALQLWQPAADPFRWIGDYVPRWLDEAALIPSAAQGLIPLARELFASLDVGRSTLLHGDLHHHNILHAGDGRYLAIDPKPMLGDREFDVPPMLWNPITHKMTLAATERRLAAFAGIGLNTWLMRAWSIIRGAYLSVNESDVVVLRSLI